MDKPINGDKYVRTLSHYLRHNQRRLVPTAIDNLSDSPKSNERGNNSHTSGARSLVTPADPMAAAYAGMVNSLWYMGTAVVNTIAPSSDQPPPTSAQDRDSFNGAWDGTGTIPADANPRERQLYLQAQLKAPIFPLDLYYLLYLLDRFEAEGIEIEGWEGSTPRAVGDSNPRVLNAGIASGQQHRQPNSTTYSSFPPPTESTRPESIRSFSSAALSTLTLITGWKQWSNAASSNASSQTVADDIHFVHKFLKMITGLRLVAKIPPGMNVPGKGRIEGYGAEGILNLLNHGQSYETPSRQVLLPMAATFSSLTHLELHKIPPGSVEGWDKLMAQLKSLVIIQSGITDRVSRERNRAVLIRQEQRDALKDATMIAQDRRFGQGSGSLPSSPLSSAESSHSSSPSQSSTGRGSSIGGGPDDCSEDEQAILGSIKMWPLLRHLSVSDNALPTLQHQDTFLYSQSIISLNMSHNLLIAPPPGLIHLHNLQSLNLSYNMISTVQSIFQILGNISVLDLRGNRLESLCGVERLWNLEKVDVRENHLDEAAEVGRLAALPGIREVWAEKNPYCIIQPKYRLEILAVFKANGHELLLDGTFASFTEKRSLANMSPTSFSTTISSISNVNLANIPAASAPSATLAKGLVSPPPRVTRPQQQDSNGKAGPGSSQKPSVDDGLSAKSPPGSNPASPVKLVKKKLVRSSKRVKRIVNLDSDHDEEIEVVTERALAACHHHNHNLEDPSQVLGPPVVIGKKKSRRSKKPSADGQDSKEKKARKKSVKKKKSQGLVSFAGHGEEENNDPASDYSDSKENHHVHRVAQLEQDMATMQVQNNNRHGSDSSRSPSPSPKHRHNRRSILKKSSNAATVGDSGGPSSPGLRPMSAHYGSMDSSGSSSDEDGAERYRRKIEAMRNEAGSNWLKVLAEMNGDVRKNTEG
ncbi:hypothetical protein BG011_005737 [Mortierella polycephala]|uniref:Leucine rich repeat domain-containing protein n=1 Tax=Mortierella polycephala TaxID=41804 RepID=A0A9P6QET7_9FUNG|nr:hypothetical protein BG011_005737 [Mortierella polycephala]